MTESTESRLIDRWFPVAAVDDACQTSVGSGRVENAIFTWFASRPIAQARAAVLTALLPDDPALKPTVETAIRTGDRSSLSLLADRIKNHYGGTAPIVLDIFSGRGIIPLEAARAGATATAIDLSPVATLAGRLLADYPARDWSSEPPLPFSHDDEISLDLKTSSGDRLARDVETVLVRVGRRVAERTAQYYPTNAHGEFPWGYLWALTIPCDGCKRRFPLLGSLVLKHPYHKSGDLGQSLRVQVSGDVCSVDVVEGPPTQEPPYRSSLRADGSKRKGKSARCVFCGHVHPLETVKAKGDAGEYADTLMVVADTDSRNKRYFRLPTVEEVEAACASDMLELDEYGPYSLVPDERIPDGNVHTVMASGYGYRTFGALMNQRQTRLFVETARAIRDLHDELRAGGIGASYARALTSFAAANMCRQLRNSTRGARLRQHGRSDGNSNNNVQVDHVFANEASVNFQFDYFEAGPGDGAGTWMSVSRTAVGALQKVLAERRGTPINARCASAVAIPLRDASVDLVICDPPYYDMIEYADASDLFYVWLKRALVDVEPDLFGPVIQERSGLQNKNDEIIVRRVQEPGRVCHDTAFYEGMLAKSFSEARRVLKNDGHLVVVFGHSDPDAWRRLLGALQSAGFVVTSAWPSRTETNNAKVASIKVTVTIGCRVAKQHRPVGIAANVDREVGEAVAERVRQWDGDGLAIEDQLMASYGPAMEVYGRYSRVITPDGTGAELDRYLTIARRAVRDSMRLRVDELPLETFDAITRFAVFWLRAKGRADVPKGEARFFAQADELRLEALREQVLAESRAGFRLRLDAPVPLTPQSSLFEVVRGMAAAWHQGGTHAVAAAIAAAGRDADDQHLWAVVAELGNQLPASDTMANALAAIKRSTGTIGSLAASARQTSIQARLFAEEGH